MHKSLENLRRELEAFGKANDAVNGERARRMLNITRDTGEFLSVLVRAAGARRVLEIGTSNGYSTVWLAEAAIGAGGSVTTVECSDYKVGLASDTFARSGLGRAVTLVFTDAANVLRRASKHSYDFLFLDADRSQYLKLWPDLRRVLCPRGLLVVDNAVSHATELEPFFTLVKSDSQFTTSLVPVGNGEFLAVKASG